MRKLLSVIVPSYNMEAYLPKCLSSLIIDNEDLFRKLDIIVVNDGSKDRTGEIAHEFERKYKSVFKVIDKANGHYGSCINCGLREAQGRYVKILDADDLVDTVELARYLGWLDSLQNQVDCIITDLCYINNGGQESGRLKFGFKTDGDVSFKDLACEIKPVFTPALTYRTALLRAIGYKQTEGMLYTDGEWCFTPLIDVKSIRYCPVALYKYLVGREGQSVATYGKNVTMQVHLLKYIVDKFRTCRSILSDDCRRYLEKFIKHIASISYSTYFFKCPIRMINAGVADVDQYLKRHVPDIYDEMDDLSILSSTRYKYHYLRRWRKSGRLSFVVLWVMQLYMKQAVRVHRLIKR